MEPASKSQDPDARLKGFTFPNGAVMKPHRPPPTLPPPATTTKTEDFHYRECMKNHAACLGAHALDGCGEFMPSPAVNPADPTSLKCAACGCHRNFHRRVAGQLLQNRTSGAASGECAVEGEGDCGEDDAFGATGRRRGRSPPPPYLTSAPHMLLALSNGVRGGASAAGGERPFTFPGPVAASPSTRKRFRTKFSPEQKEKMLELSKRLGWRLQKRDDDLVEEYCREIGVGKGVFKVWMHNNKHQFGSSASRRGEAVSTATAAGVFLSGAGAGGRAAGGNFSGGDSGDVDGNGNGHVMNGSSSSS